jgi:hypothetical protein
VAGAWRTGAQRATLPALYWLVLSLITFLGMSEVIKIEATRTRLSLVVVVVGVAFSAACFLERLLRDYMRTDIQPNGEPSDVTVSLPQWLKRNKERPGAKHRGKGERRSEPQTGAPQTQEGLLNLKDVIRLLRKEVKRAGSQRAFARKSKVNVGVVSKTLRGIVLPPEKILSALNLRVVYLSK